MDATREDSPVLVFVDGYSYTEFFLCKESSGVIFTRIFHAMFSAEPPARTTAASHSKPLPAKSELI